jgi:hypothetical protein
VLCFAFIVGECLWLYVGGVGIAKHGTSADIAVQKPVGVGEGVWERAGVQSDVL